MYPSRDPLASEEICKQKSEIEIARRHLAALAIFGHVSVREVVGVRVGVANFLLNQSIDIDETNTFLLKCYFSH